MPIQHTKDEDFDEVIIIPSADTTDTVKTHNVDEAFLELASTQQAAQIGRFPEGIRVMHALWTRNNNSNKSHMRVSFGTVSAMAIHLPTRGNAYKVDSQLAESSYVLEEELVFAQETPIWAVLPGESVYTQATVVSGATSKEEPAVQYSICAVDSMEVYGGIGDKFVCYRGSQQDPPPGTVPVNPAIKETIKVSVGPLCTAENKGTTAAAQAATLSNLEVPDQMGQGSCSSVTTRTAAQLSLSLPLHPTPHHMLKNREEPPTKKHRTDHLLWSQSQRVDQRPAPSTDSAGGVPNHRPAHDAEAPQKYSAPVTSHHAVEVSHGCASHQTTETQEVRIPAWANLGNLKDVIMQQRSSLRKRLQCWISMNHHFMKLTGGPAIVAINAPISRMDECIQAVQVWIAESLTMANERTLMMYELAFANPQWSKFDGELALNYVPRHYSKSKWIGIVPLRHDQYTTALFDTFLGGHGREILLQQFDHKHLWILEMKNTMKPHFVVCGWKIEATRRGLELVRSRLRWAEGELRARGVMP